MVNGKNGAGGGEKKPMSEAHAIRLNTMGKMGFDRERCLTSDGGRHDRADLRET